MFGIKLRPKRFLGVDIGTSSIRIIELARKGKKIELANYGEADISSLRRKLSKNSLKNSFLFSDEEITETIRLIRGEAGIQTKEANFSIPDFSSFFIAFEIPKMDKDEVSEAIKSEIRPYIPLPFSEITLDWIITEGEVSKTPLKILAVAIPNKIIIQYQEIAFSSGLKLRTLEPEVFSLTRALLSGEKESEKKKIKEKKSFFSFGKKEKFSFNPLSDGQEESKEGKKIEFKKEKITGLIDIGARSATCSVVEGSTLKASHSFRLAGNELTERLAKSLNIEYNRAERLRDKYGLSFVGENGVDGFGKNVKKILLPSVDLLLENIKKVFRDFYKDEGKEVEIIILAGGLALMPGLKEYFFLELKKKIIISNPFLNISCPPILKEFLEKKGPFYAVATGLALKEIRW